MDDAQGVGLAATQVGVLQRRVRLRARGRGHAGGRQPAARRRPPRRRRPTRRAASRSRASASRSSGRRRSRSRASTRAASDGPLRARGPRRARRAARDRPPRRRADHRPHRRRAPQGGAREAAAADRPEVAMRVAVAATASFGADVLERLARGGTRSPTCSRGRTRRAAAAAGSRRRRRRRRPSASASRSSSPSGPSCRAEPVDAVVVCAYGLLIPDDAARTGALAQRPPLAAAALARRRARRAGDPRRRRGDRRDDPRDGQGARRGPDRRAGALPDRARRRRRRDLRAARPRSPRACSRRVLPDPSFTPQPEEGVTYAEKITPADRELDLADPVDAWRRVRALSPHIGAWATSTDAASRSGAPGSRTAPSCPSRCSPRGSAG